MIVWCVQWQLRDSSGLLHSSSVQFQQVICVEFFGNSEQLQQHDSVHLSSAYTNYSFLVLFVLLTSFCLSKFSCKSKKILSVGPRHPVPLGTLRQLPHVVTPLQLAEESQRFTGLIKQNFTNINFQVFLQLYEVISNMLRLWSPYIGN